MGSIPYTKTSIRGVSVSLASPRRASVAGGAGRQRESVTSYKAADGRAKFSSEHK